MIYNVATVVDINMLNNIVDSNPRYLIMNNRTLSCIQKTKGSDYRWIDSPNYHAYRGIPIAVCENLTFGEIDTVN